MDAKWFCFFLAAWAVLSQIGFRLRAKSYSSAPQRNHLRWWLNWTNPIWNHMRSRQIGSFPHESGVWKWKTYIWNQHLQVIFLDLFDGHDAWKKLQTYSSKWCCKMVISVKNITKSYKSKACRTKVAVKKTSVGIYPTSQNHGSIKNGSISNRGVS